MCIGHNERVPRCPLLAPNVLTQTLQSQDTMTGTKCLVQTGSERVFVCGWQAK